MATQSERSQATRESLMGAGLALFSERDYADVSVAELAQAAGVTTGAVYHQFGSKQGLFKAVHTELTRRTEARIFGSQAGNKERSLLSDCEIYLDACADPRFHRLTAAAPTVIGWDRILDGTQVQIEASLQAAWERGEIAQPPVPSLARMLAAALKEAGLMIAVAEDPGAARAEASESARQLIGGLVVSRP
jgi:AcrR family transcriptional regulator